MLFAINYSPAASALLTENRIQIDRFKCPDWPEMISRAIQQRPVAVHFGFKAGNGRMETVDWQAVFDLMNQTGTAHVNFHLEGRAKDFPGLPPHSDQPEHWQVVYRRMVSDLKDAVQRYGSGAVIAENVPYRGDQDEILRAFAEPVVIRQAIEESGVGFLLDLNHARISAHALGWDERAYIGALPVERLREIHFSGVHKLEDGNLMDHLAPLDSDWELLEWALDQIRFQTWARPEMLAFEYGGEGPKFEWRSDPQVIASCAPRLYEYIQNL